MIPHPRPAPTAISAATLQERELRLVGTTSPTFVMGLSVAFLLFATVFAQSSRAEPAADLFRSAGAAYEKGDFQAAYDSWLAIVDNHGLAADLFFNLGNASQRLARPGEAVLWYQRALVLDPRHTESRQNLRVLEREVGFLVHGRNLLREFAHFLTPRQLMTTASAGFWSIVLGFAVIFTLGRSRFRGACLTLRAGGCVLLLAALAAIYLRGDDHLLLDRSIVTSPASVARTSPADDSVDVITLPPGTRVDLVAERANWSYVAIPGELRGWVHSEELAPLWPFDASFLR